MSPERPEICVLKSRAFTSGTPRFQEILVYPTIGGTSNRKGGELLTEDQAETQAHFHIKSIFLLDISGGIYSMPGEFRVMGLVGASNR